MSPFVVRIFRIFLNSLEECLLFEDIETRTLSSQPYGEHHAQ